MSVTFHVTFDAHDPEKLADFWTTVLDYELQDPPKGFDTWEQFGEHIGMPRERRHDLIAIVDPDDEKSSRVLFQKVPEDKTVKNRVHLDVHVSAGASDDDEAWRRVLAAVDKLVATGATVVGENNEPNGRCMVMRDPEGNEFCLL
jgi:catechol 2,3-dioxygenase-like lactoylglutathione lyase family enzyme